ncbi:hypothetical protein CLV24_11735 [Pontibacter ummariensis]|uniref:Uncharacterized protein n=1 Tax=Pontibacter ummariensis TaxID=1610492 RepID=A0A239IG01_9BACT|nr:hypothetical protein [Pontibacter ummariensis]PRY09831.1 hypothetical protein CLV24_11735 [Pontibacter ummariensis]SNS92495.1 hypothetical protein SAMN06296052_11735 [Pontibacter ummariensis]
MRVKSIKEVVNRLPVSGDRVIDIQNNTAIYESGGELELKPGSRLSVGDKVKSVYHEYNEEKREFFVGVDHAAPEDSVWVDGNYFLEVIKIERKRKIDIVLA